MSATLAGNAGGALPSGSINSRTELIDWLNGQYVGGAPQGGGLKKVEHCHTALPYLESACLINVLSTSAVSTKALRAVRSPAKTDTDCLHNWRLLREVLSQIGFERGMEIDKLAAGNYQLNLDFLQWFRRALGSGSGGVAASPSTALTTSQRAAVATRPVHVARAAAPPDTTEAERAYYFEKLREIEQLVTQPDSIASFSSPQQLAQAIASILYRP